MRVAHHHRHGMKRRGPQRSLPAQMPSHFLAVVEHMRIEESLQPRIRPIGPEHHRIGIGGEGMPQGVKAEPAVGGRIQRLDQFAIVAAQCPQPLASIRIGGKPLDAIQFLVRQQQADRDATPALERFNRA